MSLTARDRKIAILIVPVLLLVGYWFLLLAPKREAASTAKAELTKQEERRDEAVRKRDQLKQAKASFAGDYGVVVRLGKAIPATVDTPSLMLQLDRAARGTSIDFDKIKAGERAEAPTEGSGESSNGSQQPASGSPGGSESATSSSSSSSGATPAGGAAGAPADAGGQAAQSTPGQAAESASDASATANGQSAQAEQAGSGEGAGAKSDSGASTGGAGTEPKTSDVPGLDAVPLEFEFSGSFFELADLFHRVKRFVRVAQGDHVRVRGRLMTIDSFTLSPDEDKGWPLLRVEMKTTAYLSPKSQGVSAGATPTGPAGAAPAGGAQPAATTPSATVTP